MMRKKYYFLLIVSVLGIAFTFGVYRHSQSQFETMPINFTAGRSPLLKATIQNNEYDLKLDLGSKYTLSLDKESLKGLNKKSVGKSHWRDAKGNFYESPAYQIENIHLGGIFFKNVHVSQEDTDFVANTTLWDSNPRPDQFGVLGRPILEKTNLLLDSPHSKIIATNNKHMLKDAGYNLDQMAKVPINVDKKGMIVNVETDVGILRFVLDTGSTLTLVRSSSLRDRECSQDNRGFTLYESSKFIMGKNDFGNKKLYLYEITPDLKEVDGILGMDFFENHVIYFDYVHKCVYIGS